MKDSARLLPVNRKAQGLSSSKEKSAVTVAESYVNSLCEYSALLEDNLIPRDFVSPAFANHCRYSGPILKVINILRAFQTEPSGLT